MNQVHRAYSVLQIKAMRDEGEFFEFSGIATTPSPDRYGDVVEPLGAEFAEEIALLWQHDAQRPIGRVKLGKPSKSGIPFHARIPKVKEDGALKQRIDEAIQSIQYGIVRAVSIGFRILNDAVEALKGGGMRFLSYEIMELSAVTIPAQAEAVITAIKSLDAQQRAAVGRAVRLVAPGDSGPVKPARKGAVQIIPRN